MQLDTDELIDSAEVAQIIRLGNPKGVSVYRYRHADFPPPAIEKGRCVLWLRGDIENWAQRHRRP